MMSTEYQLPPLPFGGSEVRVTRWLRRPGDTLNLGDPLLVVVNDRVEVALPATAAGTLEALLVAEGATATVGAPLALIMPAHPASAPAHQPPAAEAADRRSALAAAGPRRATPLAARIAAASHIDITTLSGSGPGGRILKRDVLAALADRPPTTDHREPEQRTTQRVPDKEQRIDTPPNTQHATRNTHQAVQTTDDRPRATDNRQPTTMRRAIAAHMVRSRAASPHALTAMEVDMSRVADVRARLRAGFARRSLDLTYTACIALAAVEALLRHPLLNSSWSDAGIIVRRRVHLGVAVALPDGLITPIVRDAQDLNLRGMARAVGDLARRARGGALRPGQASGGTFTLTNPGGGALWFGTPIINQPQAAILEVGAIERAPLVIAEPGADRIAIRPATVLTLAYDARILDQHHADAFLQEVKRRLEQFHD